MALLSPSRTVFKFPLGANAVAGFNPLSLPSVVVWIDPSQPATVTTLSGNVSQINDLSGNGNHFAQGTAINRPAYSGTINGLNIMTFAAANTQRLICVNSPTHGPSLTVSSVHKATTIAVRGVYAVDDIGSNRILQYRWDSATVPDTVCFPGGAGTGNTGSAAPDITVAAHVFTAVIDNGAHTAQNFIDGTLNGSLSGLAAFPSAALASNVGCATTVTTFSPWDGLIGELVVCNAALTTLQRQSLEAYLRNKWGTP